MSLLLFILLNSWIWKIISLFPLIVVPLILSTIFLYKKQNILFLVTFFILLYFQLITTISQSFTLLDNDEQRVRSERLQFYKPSLHFTRVIFARFNLRDFLEGDFNTIQTRIYRNFFETIDLNIYFFAGHPRERVWADDFEKFSFIFLPLFLIGMYKIFSKGDMYFILFFLATIIILTGIGHKNNLGPFLIFPFIVILIHEGFLNILNFLKNGK